MTASLHADERRGPSPCALRLMRYLRLLLLLQRESPMVDVCCSSPEPASHWRTFDVHPVVCRGRYEGTEMFLGRRERTQSSLPSSFTRRESLKKCVVQPCCRCTSLWKSRQDMWPRDD